MSDKLKDECGVFGISLSKESPDAIRKLYLGLFALQHRGQESCGIAYKKNGSIEVYKTAGLVSGKFFETAPFNESISIGIGHVRYSTSGGSGIFNAQPLTFKFNKGEIAIAHNGNIPNYCAIKNELIQNGAIFQTTSDSEILVHIMSRIVGSDFERSLQSALDQLQGAYSILMMRGDELIAFRDPNGFRPLIYAEVENGYVFASETNALDLIGAVNYTEVEPGQIVYCSSGKIRKVKFANSGKITQCAFELIYFSRPDSIIFGESVHEVRTKMGECLAKAAKIKPDIVIPVPDSGNSAALGFSRYSGIPFEFGLIRNHYTGRSFIKPEQKDRIESVKIKLNPIKSVIQGKTVAVIDDSLVRGTTSSKISKMLRDAGAKEVHFFLSSPEIKGGCYFGIDTPTDKELISFENSPDEVAKIINADSVTFLPIEYLKSCFKEPDKYCYACFDGNYPYKPDDKEQTNRIVRACGKKEDI
ncbi:MAG: amidophosphoribosyltransferase [Spirochaetes bacterium]|nr:amidophosphoribosyltransferase [Spirochaetota bacterium]